jgi:hypothetical protein
MIMIWPDDTLYFFSGTSCLIILVAILGEAVACCVAAQYTTFHIFVVKVYVSFLASWYIWAESNCAENYSFRYILTV